MGIRSYLWEKGPEGCEKGGWGLYMSPESWARVGIMMMQGGVFMGRRILPEEWVRESTAEKAIVPEINGNFNYGYHLWVSRNGSEILFNGMLGQNVWLCPGNNIMVVMTGGNNEIFQQSSALDQNIFIPELFFRQCLSGIGKRAAVTAFGEWPE